MIKAQTRIFIYICWMIFNELRKAFLLFDCEEIFQISGWLLEKSISLLLYFHVYIHVTSLIAKIRFNLSKMIQYLCSIFIKVINMHAHFQNTSNIISRVSRLFFLCFFLFLAYFLWKKKHKKVLFWQTLEKCLISFYILSPLLFFIKKIIRAHKTMMVVEGKDNKTTTDDKHDTPFCNSNAYFLLLFVDNIFQFIALHS